MHSEEYFWTHPLLHGIVSFVPCTTTLQQQPIGYRVASFTFFSQDFFDISHCEPDVFTHLIAFTELNFLFFFVSSFSCALDSSENLHTIITILLCSSYSHSHQNLVTVFK